MSSVCKNQQPFSFERNLQNYTMSTDYWSQNNWILVALVDKRLTNFSLNRLIRIT